MLPEDLARDGKLLCDEVTEMVNANRLAWDDKWEDWARRVDLMANECDVRGYANEADDLRWMVRETRASVSN